MTLSATNAPRQNRKALTLESADMTELNNEVIVAGVERYAGYSSTFNISAINDGQSTASVPPPPGRHIEAYAEGGRGLGSHKGPLPQKGNLMQSCPLKRHH